MGQGVDDHFVEGGKMDDYKEVKPGDNPGLDKAILDEGNRQKEQLPRKMCEIMLQKHKLLCCNEQFYLMEKNSDGGGYYRRVEDREIYKAIDKLCRGKYTRKLRDDVKDLLANACFNHFERLNKFNGHLNVANGVLNVKSRILREYSPEDLFTYQIPIKYDASAGCAGFKSFRYDTFRDFPMNIQLIKTIFGYCLQTERNSERFFIFTGSGANGKGVMTYILESILGKENCSNLSLEDIGNDSKIHMIAGMLANISNESSSRSKNWSENLKTAVSGEAMIGNIKYKPQFKFYPFAKHIISMNEVPYIEDKSFGVTRRMIVMPFNNTVAEDARDPSLKYKLIENEGPGILNDCLEGLELYFKYGFLVPKENEDLARQIKIESDSVMGFVEECCKITKDRDDRIITDELYEKYREWCDCAGVGKFSKCKFTRSLKVNYGVECAVSKVFGSVKRSYFGVTLVF